MKRKIYDCIIMLVVAYFFLSISYNDLFNGNIFAVTKDLATIVRIEVFGMIYIAAYLYIYYKLIKKGKIKKGIILSIIIFIVLMLISSIVCIILRNYNIDITYNDFILRMILNVLFFTMLILRHRCKEDEKN